MTAEMVSAKEKALLCYLQDRNLFGGAPGLCPHCKERPKTVDHLATQCSRMLGHDYTRRHNEVVKSLIANDADFNAKDNDGSTALILASCSNDGY